jgi:sugar phosphate isomerase/epimerase
MHLGIFARTFPRPTLEETLDAIVDQGLYHVQFNLSCVGLPTLPERLDENHCVWIARSFRQRGLTMAAISGTFNLCDPDAARLQDNLHRLEILAAGCRWLDTRIITLCTGTLDPEDMWRWHPENVRRSTWNTLVASVRQALEIADRHEVTLAFEPELNNVVNSVAKARRLLDEIGSPWLKVVIDPANLIRPGELPRASEILEEAFDWLGSDIVLAHAKNPRKDESPGRNPALSERVDSADFWALVRELAADVLRGKMTIGLSETQHGGLYEIFSFYYHYFQWLNTIQYGGTIVIHGLPESEVGPTSDLLTRLLLCFDRSP